jgi:hypothetical protein
MPTSESSFRYNVGRGVRTGMTVAIGFSLIALGLYAVGGESAFEANHMTLLGVIVTYAVGGLCIGAIGGALTPFMRSTVGFALGTAILGALAYVAFQVEESGPYFWRHFEWPLSIIFAGIGIATGFAARSRIRSRARARGERSA